MRFLSGFILVVWVVSVAAGQGNTRQDNPRQARVQAAVSGAVSDLFDQIGAEPLNGTLTVKDFLDQTHGAQVVLDVLNRSEQIGGPRWLDDSTCQVRLQASGDSLARALIKIASDHPKETPVAAWEMARLVAPLEGRTFTATGNSAAVGVNPVPPAGSAWAAVPADERQETISAADLNAVNAVLSSIASLDLGDGHSVAEALHVKAINDALAQWLMSRPVTSIDYRRSKTDNALEVEVTLSATASDLFDTFRAILTARSDVAHPSDDAGWDRLRREMVRAMAPPVGDAELAVAETEPAPSAAAVVIPAQPPDWAAGMLDTVGSGAPMASALRAARAAEDDGLKHIRSQVMALRLTPDETVGEACRRDAHLAARLERTIGRGSKTYKTEYRTDGSVTVRMSLDLRLVWTTLAEWH